MKNSRFDGKTALLLVILCAGWTLLYADRTALYPLLTVIGEKYCLSSIQLGTITSSYFVVYVAMQIPSGILADKIGNKVLLTATYLLSGLALLLFGLFAKNFLLLLFFTAFHGFGAGAYFPTAYGILLTSVKPNIRATAIAIVNLGMSFGLIIGLALSGPLYLYTKSYSGIFTVLGLLTIVTAFFFYKMLPETAQSASNFSPDCFPIIDIIKDKNLVLLNMAQFCSLYGYWVALTWGAAFFQKERGIDIRLAGLLVAIVGISSIFPSVVSGRISDKIGRKKMALLLFPMGGLTIFLLPCASSTSAIICALVAYGVFGKASWDPIGIAWMSDHAFSLNKNSVSTATGVYNFSGMMSAVIGPIISGLIRDLTGSLAPAFYVAAVLSLLGTLFVYLVDEKPSSISSMSIDS